MSIKKIFTLFMILFSGIIHVLAFAQNSSKNHEEEVLHLIGDDFDIRVTLPNAVDRMQRLDSTSKMLLAASFPAYQIGTEAVVDDVTNNVVSVINILTGEKQPLYKFPNEYLTGMTGGIDKNDIYVSTYRRKFDGKFQILKINKKSQNARLVVEAKSMFFSVRCGTMAYVGDKNQIIIRKQNGKKEIVAANGKFPVMLPSCNGFVFGSSSNGLHKLVIYSETESQNIENRSIVKSLTKEFNPLVRVSRDSKYIAFKYKSDISIEPVRVIRIIDGKEIYVSKLLLIKNWYFLN